MKFATAFLTLALAASATASNCDQGLAYTWVGESCTDDLKALTVDTLEEGKECPVVGGTDTGPACLSFDADLDYSVLAPGTDIPAGCTGKCYTSVDILRQLRQIFEEHVSHHPCTTSNY
jgi:hypothetical protein